MMSADEYDRGWQDGYDYAKTEEVWEAEEQVTLEDLFLAKCYELGIDHLSPKYIRYDAPTRKCVFTTVSV